jgi:hypothetical protein
MWNGGGGGAAVHGSHCLGLNQSEGQVGASQSLGKAEVTGDKGTQKPSRISVLHGCLCPSLSLSLFFFILLPVTFCHLSSFSSPAAPFPTPVRSYWGPSLWPSPAFFFFW